VEEDFLRQMDSALSGWSDPAGRLRDALERNDTSGITLAGGKLEEFVSRVAETRALVGGYARRVDDAQSREQDQNVLDETIRSNVRDLDYAEAAVRLSLLQTQYQAGLQTTALLQGQSLLNFL
jgi:flagellar hook-associated protein 3 FlgL